MASRKVAKVTISLPRDLLDTADRLARERSATRSSVIAELLAREERERVQALMDEGYREMAEENVRLAEASFPMASEVIARSTQWDEGECGDKTG